MRSTLCDAIDNQNLVEFYYRGKNRVVEPHKVAKTTKRNVVLSGYQVGGQGNDINPPDWGQYKLNKISSLKVTNRMFSGPRPEYSRDDQRMVDVYCCL